MNLNPLWSAMFCEGIERDTFILYLDPIVEHLFNLLNPTGENVKQPKCYMQEQAVTMPAMMTDASEATFTKVSLQKLLSCLSLFVANWISI
jgi:hypothetical protein